MEKEKQIKYFFDLAQLDIDAVYAYEQALRYIDDAEVSKQIEVFKEDHVRHIGTLSEMIIKLDGTPPEHKKDLKGFLIEGMTMLRSMAGTEGALKAMRSNEELTNRKYREALQYDFSGQEKAILQSHYEDEQRHLAYMVERLEAFEKV